MNSVQQNVYSKGSVTKKSFGNTLSIHVILTHRFYIAIKCSNCPWFNFNWVPRLMKCKCNIASNLQVLLISKSTMVQCQICCKNSWISCKIPTYITMNYVHDPCFVAFCGWVPTQFTICSSSKEIALKNISDSVTWVYCVFICLYVFFI